jgi:tetratricopeptide (TPR) repeat protein
LDVLLALRPGDAELLRRHQQAQQAALAAAQDKWQAARAAQTRGETESATRLYLEVLALTPSHSEAADALRQIEQDRVRRQHLGQLSRYVLVRRGSGMEPSPVNLVTSPRPGSEGNDVEHASLLAAQGDLDSAIQIIRPAATAPNPDPAARQLLADLYFRQGEALAGTDKVAAIAALERAVQTDPGHAKATARLREIRASLSTGTKTIPAKPAPATRR